YDLEAKTGRLIRTAQVGERAHGVVVRPDGLEIWTANRSGAVTILDAETLEILVSLPMGNYANHIAFSRDGRYAYVSRDQDVAVLDVATRTNVATVPVGNEPHELSLEDWIMPSSTLHYPALDDLVRQASSSGIQVTVTWLTPDHLRTESHDIAPNDLIGRLALFVQLDTHAGNLLRYDVAQHALLKTGDGRSIHPLHWQGISEDSHHRRGILWFLANDETGSLITEAGAGSIMLILQELGRTPERTFHWDLGR
ncbi:MAG: YncE family protein, partial [Candidatus Bipolaricaulia bacterium]